MLERLLVERNHCLDAFRLWAAFLVVCIHFNPHHTIALYLIPICRVAVPFFFMITGYYLGDLSSPEIKSNIVPQIKKIVPITLVSAVFYFILLLITESIAGQTAEYLNTVFSVTSLLNFVFLNNLEFAGFLWYLLALLYVLIIIYFAAGKFGKKLYILIPILLAANVVLGNYAFLVFHDSIHLFFTRNFLFAGLPYVLLGSFMHDKRKEIRKIGNAYFPFVIILFSATSVLERFFLGSLNELATQDHFISTPFLTVTIFAFCIRNPLSGKSSFVGELGRKYSLMIYIIHVGLEPFVAAAALSVMPEGVYSYIAPILIFAAAFVFSVVFTWCIEHVESWIKKKHIF